MPRALAVFRFTTKSNIVSRSTGRSAGFAPRNIRATYDAERRTTYSFRMLSAAEVRALRPLRVRIEPVQRGDTAQTLARRMAFEDFRL